MGFLVVIGAPPQDPVELTRRLDLGPGQKLGVQQGKTFCAVHDVHAEIFPTAPGPRATSAWRLWFEGYLDHPDGDSPKLARAGSAVPPSTAERIAAVLDHASPAALRSLSGCFVLFAHHPASGRSIALRDRLGGRTLYYRSAPGGRLIVTTRSAWAAQASGQAVVENPEFVVAQLALHNCPQPGHSAFAEVHELMPGEELRAHSGPRIAVTRPSLSFATTGDGERIETATSRFIELLDRSVSGCLANEGDTACMLSGGLDSAPMAVLADRALARRPGQLRITSWVLSGFERADERRWIERIAADLDAACELFDGSNQTPYRRLDEAPISLDLPLYNPVRELVNQCYRNAAREGCTVILNGNAGDELYAPLHLVTIDRVRRRQWRAIAQDFSALWRRGGWRAVARDPAYRHPLGRLLGRAARPSRPPNWLTRQARRHFRPPPTWPPESQHTPFPEYTRRLFGASMAFGRAHESAQSQRFGVDRRDPYHNEALARFMLHAPFDWSWHGGRSKALMRRASCGLLPEAIRLKGRTGLLDEFVLDGFVRHRKAIARLLFEEQTGWQAYVRREAVQAILAGDASPALGLIDRLIGLALWQRQWGG